MDGRVFSERGTSSGCSARADVLLDTTSEVPFRRFPGEVAAADTSDMSFDVPGRLIEFPAMQGMTVKYGTLLGRLDETNFIARVPRGPISTPRTPNSPGGVNCNNAA
jgi:hypothetical protein